MKPSSRKTSKDDERHAERASSATNVRPSLVRAPPERLSDISKSLGGRGASPLKDEEAKDSGGAQRAASEDVLDSTNIDAHDGQATALKDAMNSKLLQQRSRRSYGGSKAELPSARVATIQEEAGTLSPHSVNPDATLSRTDSQDSGDSRSTVRAGKAPSIAQSTVPVRTPSYPFPYVPGSPMSWSTDFHQPFTTLSPTTSGGPLGKRDGRHGSIQLQSGETTPAATVHAFMPPGAQAEPRDDPRFPTPNVYDMVLKLNAEPGIEQWWVTVTNLMHDHFNAERASLVVPRDSSDIENIPWGQKATFSMNGLEELFPLTVTSGDNVASQSALGITGADYRFPGTKDIATPDIHQDRSRPNLQTRHSYAGHDRSSTRALPSTRPGGPQRVATYAPGTAPDNHTVTPPPHRISSLGTAKESSLGDAAFSNVADVDDNFPYAEVYASLRNLDHESHPLIEPGGVIRMLEKCRVVAVTRDYIGDDPEPMVTASSQTLATDSNDVTPIVTPRPSYTSIGNHRKAFASLNTVSSPRDYEEYEQQPPSPWSQSPAPSPAIQAEEDVNPFFAAERDQVEQAFSPSMSPKDYSQLGQVQAIGVDRASTVIHIPLVHPTLSQPMQSLKMHARARKFSDAHRAAMAGAEAKAPIAILSILTSAVPYPLNLTHCLKLLGPHLATSLAVSQQFSAAQPQAVTIRHRRMGNEGSDSTAPMAIVPTSLHDIMRAEVEEHSSSNSNSVTSPSDYSTRSPRSTTSSIVGTPGWDAANYGRSSNRSAMVTPGVGPSEMIDSYFDAKRHAIKRSPSTAGTQLQTTPARPARRQSGSERKLDSIKSPSPEGDAPRDTQAPRKIDTEPLVTEQSHSHRESYKRQPTGTHVWQDEIPYRTADPTDSSSARTHSQLHSYGADLHTSFGGLPSATNAVQSSSKMHGHQRTSSYPEDIPPPSERLLRIIIDSVPVQIFTAEPGTGKITWINSKFMVYRGQEARYVLNQPWQAIHPDDREDFLASWNRSLRTAQQLQQKVRLQRFDGNYRWFYLRAAPLKDKQQKIVHWIGTMMDFHEQNLAQETAAKQHEVTASEAKYRALANSSPQIVFAANRAEGITFANTRWTFYSGQSEAQAKGVGFMDHIHPEDIAKCKLPFFGDNADTPTKIPLTVTPGLSRATSGSATSSSDDSAETAKATKMPNVTASPRPLPRRKLSELTDVGILKFTRDADGRPSYSTEIRLRSKDGDYKWHLVRVLLSDPSLQHDGNGETWYGTCTDISDHKALERDLKRTMDEKSRFLSNMSHEIRTPLNGITGMVNFLIDSSLTSEQLEHVNIIRTSTEGLRGLIDDILDLSKAEAGMIQLNPAWFYPRSLLEEVNDLTSTMAIDKGLELNYIVEDEVPAQVKGDRFRVRQILLNLVGNGIKFTSKGEVCIRCSVQDDVEHALEEDQLYIIFQIIDTGRGFSNEEAEQLFKRFSQIDGSSTRQHGGTGLGLVISRQLSELHGGDMRATSVPGQGSTFTCWIKVGLPTASDIPPTPMPTPGGFNIPILPVSTVPSPNVFGTTSARPSPKLGVGHTQSPSIYGSPLEIERLSSAASSASSDPSLASISRASTLQSIRSSASSILQDQALAAPPMSLALPGTAKKSSVSSTSSATDSSSLRSIDTDASANQSRAAMPPMHSILIVCALQYSREATIKHIERTLPTNVPHQITAEADLLAAQSMLSGEDAIIFTHVVILLQDIEDILALVQQIVKSQAHHSTGIVIITDLQQKRQIMGRGPTEVLERLAAERKLQFVFKPLKPSRFAHIFDPQKEREMSLDRNHDSAQQVALTQKQVFEELTQKLGNRGKRVLLVEDNKTNQLVVLKFLAKVSIAADTALDGVECTTKILAQPPGHYSIVLCDLHMPNKDGYQTCRDIREWERKNAYAHLPIVALSANVLGDVYEKCVAAGFNSYLTKPVDFKELSAVLRAFMDPKEPAKPHEFMKMKRRGSAVAGRAR